MPEPVVTFGLIKTTTAGRTDRHNVSLPNGAYVLPADIVSAIGEGNSISGGALLDRVFTIRSGGGKPVPIIIAGGEYVVSPGDVAKLGGGNMKKGHDALDAFVLRTRKQTVKDLKNLPGPQK